MLAPENATTREKARRKKAAAKTIRRNILFVNTFSGGEVETICALESIRYQMLLINEKRAANELKSENRLEMLTCPKGKERTKPYHDRFFFSIASLRYEKINKFEYIKHDIGGRYEECFIELDPFATRSHV